MGERSVPCGGSELSTRVAPVLRGPRSARRTRFDLVAAACVVAVMGVLSTGAVDELLPSGLLSAMEANGEAPAFFALVLVGRVAGRARDRRLARLWWAGLGAATILSTGVGDELGFGSSWLTLREPFLAAAVIGAYTSGWLGPRRRPVLSLVLIAIVVVGEIPVGSWDDGVVARWIVIYAEAAGMVLLTGLLFDVVRPWPAHLARPARPSVRVIWYVALAAVVAGIVVRNPDGVDAAVETAAGLADHVELWLLRNVESFLAVLVLTAWLDLDLGSRRLVREPTVGDEVTRPEPPVGAIASIEGARRAPSEA